MDDITFNITGLDELQDALESMPPKVAKRGTRQALREGAAIIRDAMVFGAPKESGFLSEHIDVKTKLERDALAGTSFVGPNSKMVYPRKPGWHARTAKLISRWLEFGTSKMAKKPFLTQAFESNKETALGAIIEKLGEVVEQAADEAPKGPQV